MNGILEAVQNPAVWAGVLGASALCVWGLPVQATLRWIGSIVLLGFSIIPLVIVRQEYTLAGVGHMDATAAIITACCIGCLAALVVVCVAGSTWNAIGHNRR